MHTVIGCFLVVFGFFVNFLLKKHATWAALSDSLNQFFCMLGGLNTDHKFNLLSCLCYSYSALNLLGLTK